MLPKETALSKLAKTMVKPITVKPPTKTTSSPTTTIPYDEWSKQIDELMAAVPVTTTPTTVPKVSALPKGYKPIGSQPAPEGTIGIDTKGNFFLGTGKVVRKENFKPGSSSVMYNPGPKTKTTTPKAPTPPVTVPKAYPELTTTQTPDEDTQEAIDASREAQAGATNLGITETKKKPGGWRGALANIVNFDIVPGKLEFKPIETAVIKPLIVLDTGRRAFVSGFQESIEFAKDIREGKQVYTATDYIPKHPQTGKPIARIGDPIIDNADVILSTPIPIINNKTLENFTDRELQKATDKIVNEKGTTSGGSFKDWYKQTKDPTTGFGDIPYIKTGNKWLDRGIGFFGDVALDPVTYATFGGSAIVKPVSASTRAAAGTAVTRANANLARVVADATATATERAAAQATVDAAKKLLKDISKTGSKAQQAATLREEAKIVLQNRQDDFARIVADPTSSVVEKKAAEAALVTARKELELTTKKAANATPRRLYGAQARENAANAAREIRDEAAKVAADTTAAAAERTVAQKTVDALSDDLIGEIATKGYTVIKGAAAEALGVQNGFRWGLPGFNKAALLPKLTAPFSDAVGKATSWARLGFVNTSAGAEVLKRITPLGAGGLFSSSDILKMRTALRQGTVKGTEASDYVSLLSLDKLYRGQKEVIRKAVGQSVRELTGSKGFKKSANKLSRYLETPEAEWVAKGFPPLTSTERAVLDDVRDFFDTLLDDADIAVKELGGPGLTRAPNYFPHVQTTDALQWSARNGNKLAKVAADLGVDPTALMQGNFMARNLAVDSIWFGKRLTADDIAGGVKRLNQIAIDSGEINFKFFAEDLPTAIARYAENYASFKTYAVTVGRMPDAVPTVAKKVSEIPTRTKTGIVVRPRIDGLVDVETRILNLMDKDKLLNWSTDQIDDVRNRLDDISSKLTAGSIDRMEFDQAVLDLDEYILAIDRDIASGAITPPMAALLVHEAENYATALASQIDNVKSTFAVTSPLKWKMVTSMVDDISYPMSRLNPNTIPDIAVKNEVLEMFTNVKRLDDPKFAQLTEVLLKDITTFMKTYVTATPGFYLRNAIGNTFTMIAAGGNPTSLIRGMEIYRRFAKALKNTDNIGEAFEIATKGLSKTEKEFVSESLAYSGATGFGQIGEVATAAGAGKTGAFGKEATGKVIGAGKGLGKLRVPDITIPGAKKVSETLYAPLRGLRNKGAAFEEASRFSLLYDGLRQGYDSQTAASRVNKYLIDYQDLTTLDKNIKQIIPFWMFFSRNLPLQVENMWMNPRAYSIYMSGKRNLEDRESDSESVPDYLKQAGAFKLPGTSSFEIPGTGAIPGRGGRNIGVGIGDDFYAKPDLGFPGAGQPNIIQQFASGDAPAALGNLGSPFKQAIEITTNTQLFSGAPITDPSKTDEENARRKKEYYLINIVPALGTAGRWLTPFGGKVPKTVRDLTGARLDAELQATLSLIGAPGFKLLESQERFALWRKYRDLKDVIKADTEARIRRAKADEGLLKDE